MEPSDEKEEASDEKEEHSEPKVDKNNDKEEVEPKTDEKHKADKDVHVNEDGLTCEDCGKWFAEKRYVFRHKREKHRGTEFHVPCRECGKMFTSKRNLKTHRDSLHLGITFPCTLCKKVFTRRNRMNHHVKRAHGKGENEGDKIEESMYSNDDKEESPEPKCGNSNDDKIIAKNTDGYVHDTTCGLCGKLFTSKSNCFRHKKEKHSGPNEIHACPDCGKNFTRTNSLKIHRDTVHLGLGKQFPCTLCEKIFTTHKSQIGSFSQK